MRERILSILFGLTVSALFVFIGYNSLIIVYREGFKDGVTTTLDSINSIVNRQLTDKTISSKFLIQSSDTLEFILSPKTIKMK